MHASLSVKSSLESEFIHFLEDRLLIQYSSIELALKYYEKDLSLLPIVLWKYGLASLDEVEHMFAWLETQRHPSRFDITDR